MMSWICSFISRSIASGLLPPPHVPSVSPLGHYDQHRNCLVPAQQVVHDDAGASVFTPVRFVVATSVTEVQHRKSALRLGIVGRRKVDVELSHPLQRRGRVGSNLNGPVRDTL